MKTELKDEFLDQVIGGVSADAGQIRSSTNYGDVSTPGTRAHDVGGLCGAPSGGISGSSDSEIRGSDIADRPGFGPV